MALSNAERQARHRKKMGRIPKRSGVYDIVRLYYSEEHDQFFLVSHDETTALPIPMDISGHMDDLRKDEEDRLRCHPGFVPWSPRGKEGR